MPMRISPAGASNCFSFSSQICQPSLALAKVIDLMTTLLSGRQMQPTQHWLPISIPQTYLMTAPSEEGAGGGIFMAHLLFSFKLGSCSFPRIIAASFLLPSRQARNPTSQGERQLMLDRQSGPATLGEPLAVATSLIDPFCPGGRGAVSSRRSLFKYLNRPQANTSALPLLTPVYSPKDKSLRELCTNYYMSQHSVWRQLSTIERGSASSQHRTKEDFP